MRIRPEQILETCIYVDDLDKAEKFYHEVLGLELISKTDGRHLFFRMGRSVFLIFNPKVTIDPNTDHDVPVHGAIGQCHTAFAVKDNEIDGWRDLFSAKGVDIEKDITWERGGRSLYFRDPTGNSIELGTTALWGIREKTVFE